MSGEPGGEKRQPTDPESGQALPPREQPGYYPGFRTLEQQAFWDEATRGTVLKRVRETPVIRFFTEAEARMLETLCAHLLPQDDRTADRRVPIVPHMDARLAEGRTPGYRFERMPLDGVAHREGFRAMDAMARHQYGRDFLALKWREQEEILKSIHDGKPVEGAAEIWAKMPAERYWALLLGDMLEVYYAHPWAWDEIGFGGPAYPRGYMRLERGEAEPWEVEERRYAWCAPAEALSDPAEEEIAAHQKHPPSGQGGTH